MVPKILVFDLLFAYNHLVGAMKLHTFLYASLIFFISMPTITFGFCFDDAGRRYGINPALLRSIARTESNLDPSAVNKNANGTFDLGLMQINSQWLQKLNTSEKELLDDACFNVETGARILRECIDRYGYTWEAVGCYNAYSKVKRVNYAWKVFNRIKREATSSEPKHAGTLASSSVIKKGQEKTSLLFRVRDITETAEATP